MEIEVKIKNKQLKIYEVDYKYRKYLEKFEPKVSQKDNRKFYGILIKKDQYEYCIPFTSKVKHRNPKLTINIKNKGKIIAQLLLNNMIPIIEDEIKLVDVDKEKYVDYLKSEIIYLSNKNVINEIIRKSKNIFEILENKESYDYNFFKKLCCNFKKLENVYLEYKENIF